MNTRLSTCVSIAAVCALLAAPAWAQTEDEPQRKVGFVSGEARTLDSGRTRFSAPLCKIVATFQTRPVLADVSESYITRGAFAAVFGPKDPQEPYDPRTLAPGEAWIDRKTIYADDEARARDLWTIAAIDEATAKALTHALFESCAANVQKALDEKRGQLERVLAREQQRREAIDKLKAQIKEAEELCGKLTVDKFSSETIAAAIARFDHERRLNEIDIAALEARLAAAKERLEARQGAEKQQGKDSAELRGEAWRALHRIQVELEIELIGKLARREAVGRELEQLKRGLETRQRIDGFEGKLAVAQRPRSGGGSESSLRKSIEQLERLANFTVIDNRVVISPIAPTRR